MTMNLGHDSNGDEGSATSTHRRVNRLLVATGGLWGAALVASLVQFGVPNNQCSFFSSTFIAAVGVTWSGLFSVATGVLIWQRRSRRQRVKPSKILYVGIVILFLLAAATTYVFSDSDYQGYHAPVTNNCLDF
jgi:ABC-type Fe3+-siderophore transport system permease subunit